jgi:hypothetical protein
MRDQDPQIDAARERMLPVLLAEVRRVRRRRRVGGIAVGASIGLVAALLAIAGRPMPTPGPAIADRTPANGSDGTASVGLSPSSADGTRASHVKVEYATATPSVRVEVVSGRDGLQGFTASRAPTVQVELVTTEQAYAILESTGERYGVVEYSGRVEFVRVAAK